ncbi:alpha/beta-hydrolase [Lindgomyces ingoldianus]|uniref:Alpha/beta-hydrolase n=1 Tax=Lindgomyces ingoldianus TaxID=673940 RepID=A0ACB6RAZ7_9PLEO|nr:alpha/beta-hydrolase [Lindgomyces ingoldianus]KAF2476444.1 alpha/beta-hydrolase [Lindgomyces ingoldianus]
MASLLDRATSIISSPKIVQGTHSSNLPSLPNLSSLPVSSRLPLYLSAGAASVGLLLFINSLRGFPNSGGTKVIPSPRETLLPRLSTDETKNLPYPPYALPGARDVDSPYGTTRVYEWGPKDGPKVLLLHGISTPSIALAGLAYKLVEKGCRVMLFDLFSRGHSSGPSPATNSYSSALYTSQILLVLQSSPLSWTSTSPFTIVGYSLGGAIAADFTSYFTASISHLILIAPGGLIRTTHITWKSRFLYSTSGLLPEWMIHSLVARRLWTGPNTARSIEPEGDVEAQKEPESEKKGGLRSHAVYLSPQLNLLPTCPNSTVGNVVDWQIQHHRGFVPAFVSTIRFAPIHNQHHRWRIIGEKMKIGGIPLKKVNVILGENDPIIVAEEVAEDVKEVLGEDYVQVQVLKGAGHELAIDKVDEIASLVGRELGLARKAKKSKSRW